MLRPAGAAGLAAVTVTVLAAVSGCSASRALHVGDAYLQVPRTSADVTSAYVDIRDNGAADRLIAASTSAGGTVTLRGPAGPGANVTAMRTVSSIPVPAGSTVHLAPNTYHLTITGARGLRDGKAITLKLTFAHAGTVSVTAVVLNPDTTNTGGYFGN